MEDGKVKEVTSMEGLEISPAENTGIGARKSPALAPLTKVYAVVHAVQLGGSGYQGRYAEARRYQTPEWWSFAWLH